MYLQRNHNSLVLTPTLAVFEYRGVNQLS